MNDKDTVKQDLIGAPKDPLAKLSTGHGSQKFGEPSQALPEFKLADLSEKMQAGVAKAGWTELMPVQAKTIPYFLAGRDMMIQSRTGSGKTGAFILPILERIDSTKPVCQAMVLVPTRELARQVAQEAELLSADSGIRTVAVYGGTSYGPQIAAFREGAHLVVGTPGRILDHLLKNSLSLDHLRMLVFDEADRMLSMGFYPDMKRVQRYLPNHRVNGCMFSATFPPYVIRLADEFLREPGMLSLSTDQVHVAAGVEHVFYPVPAMDKDRALVRIIEMENPVSAIIFCNTKVTVHYVTVVLRRFGYDADELTSDLAQGAREKVMGRARQGNLRFLVATDVASRGIDLPDLSHVFIYETPEDPESYIHRAGRTGRAGAGGEVVSLVAGVEKIYLSNIAKRYGVDLMERPLPQDEDVKAIVSERIIATLEAKLRCRDRIANERMQRFTELGKRLAQGEDESAIIAMLLDDFYQQTLGAIPLRPPTETKEAGTVGSGSASQHTERRSGGGGGGGGGGRRRNTDRGGGSGRNRRRN